MAQLRQECLDHQLRYWMRPDWRRYWKPGHENDPLHKEFERVERKYRPDQLRVPRGSEGGGRWADEGAGGGRGTVSGAKPANVAKPKQQIAARISPQREAECEEQLRLDEFICSTVGTSSCWGQAYFRYSQCLTGGYIPPIYH
jgi:hypothetical protein